MTETKIIQIKKRNGEIVTFDPKKIQQAIFKALRAVNQPNQRRATALTELVVLEVAGKYDKKTIPTVEEIQDIVEIVLIRNGLVETAKAFILYRAQRTRIRESKSLFVDVNNTVFDYISKADWRVAENSNTDYSFSGLVLHISGKVIANYVLNNVYSDRIQEAHKQGYIHIHDLSHGIVSYCAGWSLKDLLLMGFGNVPNKADSYPAKHLSTAVGQMVNFLGVMQMEHAGAQAFSVHGKETIILKDKNDNISIQRIGDFTDRFIEKNKIRASNIEDADISHLGFKTLSFDDKGHCLWKKVKRVIKHPITDPLHILKTNKGLLCVSKNHSVFSLKKHIYLGGAEKELLDIIKNNKSVRSDKIELYTTKSRGSVLRMLSKLKNKGVIRNRTFKNPNGQVAFSEYSIADINNNITSYKTSDLKVSKEVKSVDVKNNIVALNTCNLKQNTEFDLYSYLLHHEKLREITRVYGDFNHIKENIQSESSLRQESLKIGKIGQHLWSLLKQGYLPLKLYEKYKTGNEAIKLGKIRKSDLYNPIIKGEELETLLKLIAWYISEGWATKDYKISFTQSKLKNIKQIEHLLNKLKCPYFIQEYEDNKKVFVIGGFLGTIINNTCGKYCDNKQIPSFVFDLSNKYKQIFIDEILKGDGYKRSTGKAYVSTSNLLITGLNLLLISLGYRTSIKTRFEENFENFKICNTNCDTGRLTRYDLVIHSNKDTILKYNDIESAILSKNMQFDFKTKYEYDISVEDTERFFGGVGLFGLHNSSVDTYLAPFVRADNLNYKTVKQCIQHLIYGLNIASRWGGQCVSEDTECLTDNGWKFYHEIDINKDQIATFNIYDGNIEYLVPKRIKSYDYNGDLIRLKNRLQDHLVTPNHKIVRKKFNSNEYVMEEAEALLKFKNGILIPNSGETGSIKEVEDHLVELIAWLVSEGNFSADSKKSNRERIAIYQSEKNIENCDKIRGCLTRNDLEWDEFKRIHGFAKEHASIRFRINTEGSKRIRKTLSSKKVPNWLKTLSKRQIKLFLETYIQGDGSVEKGRIRIYSKDKEIKDSIQELCALVGWGTTNRIRENEVYTINIIRNQHTQVKLFKTQYKGKVWCPTTKNGTFVARRNGKVFITGNTPFTNLTFDLTVPADLKDHPAIVGGKELDTTYGDYQKEMDMINHAFLELMEEGDAKGRIFTFPIPTYNLTKDFDWDSSIAQRIFEVTAKYGIPYFQNYCLVRETEIIAKDLKGRVRKTNFNSLKEDWEILTPSGFKKVLEKHHIQYNDKPLVIAFNNGEKVSCSENHLFPTENGLKRADQLRIDDLILVAEYFYDDNTRGGEFDYGRFLGLFLAEGYIEKEGTRINFPNRDKLLIDFVDKFSKKHFMSSNTILQRDDGLFNLYINSRALVSFIHDFSLGKDAKSKRLRGTAFDSSINFRKGLIQGYYEGDGNKSKHDRFEASSMSHELMKDIRSMLISLGKRTTFRRICIEAKGNDRKYMYLVTEASTNTQASRTFLEKNGKVYCKVSEIKKSKSSAKELVDIKIEGTDKLFTLANGIVTHNCGSDLDPGDIRAMCCRLNIDQRELMNRPGNMWGAGENTGSIGVTTINLNRIAYESASKKEYFERLSHLMEIARDSLELKRKVVNKNLKNGLMPYTKTYLGTLVNHFSTIGLCGMNEACINLLKVDLSTKEGKAFAIETLEFMREKIRGFQEETSNLYNLEATPAESTAYRFAKLDREKYPDIITAGTEDAPYLTNSTQLAVDTTTDVFFALEHQNDIQPLYTGGTIFHSFLGERLPNAESCKNLVRKIAENTKLPYFSITPTFSVCPSHGYLIGEHPTCPEPECGQTTEVYSRIVGYFRPVQNWNVGKKQEFKDRITYKPTMEITDKSPEIPLNIETETPSANKFSKILVFTQKSCPRCPSMKQYLQINTNGDLEEIDAGTEEGLKIAKNYGIMSTPTVVFLDNDNSVIGKVTSLTEVKKWV